MPIGGGNPGTPAYVGMIGIILRRQKNTSGYMGITPLLVKLCLGGEERREQAKL
jgi:hypothetical protein